MEFRVVADRILSSKSQGFESNVKNSTIQSNVERRATYGYESQRSDNVVCHAERDISVCGLRILRQQPLGILICFFRSPQGSEVPFLQNRLLVRFHSSSKRQRKKSFTVFWVSFLTLPRQLAGLSQSFAEAGHALWIRLAINPAKEFFFVQEEITGQHPLAA